MYYGCATSCVDSYDPNYRAYNNVSVNINGDNNRVVVGSDMHVGGTQFASVASKPRGPFDWIDEDEFHNEPDSNLTLNDLVNNSGFPCLNCGKEINSKNSYCSHKCKDEYYKSHNIKDPISRNTVKTYYGSIIGTDNQQVIDEKINSAIINDPVFQEVNEKFKRRIAVRFLVWVIKVVKWVFRLGA
jgi:hypothetical protein